MADSATLKQEVELSVSVEDIAALFCELDDDAQANFFVLVAERMGTWGALARDSQAINMGSHLRNCSCSTPAARDFAEAVMLGLKEGTH